MTDEQIIKALEYCCGNITFDSDCSAHGCYQASLPEDRNGDIRWCRQWLMKDALELIERQKAEIDELKQKLQQAKSEAIKEFVARLCKGRVENDPVVIATKAELDYVLGVGMEVQE